MPPPFPPKPPNKCCHWKMSDTSTKKLTIKDIRSWQVLTRGPSRDRIARSYRRTGPDLTVRMGVKDRIARLLLLQYVLGIWGPFKPWLCALKSSKKQPQDRKAIFETLSLPVAKILSPVAKQAPTKRTPSSFPQSERNHFNRSLVRTRVWRGLSNRPRTLKTAERKRTSWKRALSLIFLFLVFWVFLVFSDQRKFLCILGVFSNFSVFQGEI